MIKTEAIVLSHLKYGEHSVIATLYTSAMGRQSVLVKGAFGKKTPMKASLFRPLYLLDISLRYSARRQLQYISDMSLSVPFLNIPYDPVKSGIALFLSEVLYRTLRGEEADAALFAFLSQTIQLLDLNRHGTANFHLVFLLRLARFLGFSPPENFLLDMQGVQLPASRLMEDNALLNKLLHLPFDALETVELNRERRNELLDIILTYYTVHVEGVGEIQSADILKTLFS